MRKQKSSRLAALPSVTESMAHPPPPMNAQDRQGCKTLEVSLV